MNGSFVMVESNTTGGGLRLARLAAAAGYAPVVLTAQPDRYPDLWADSVGRRVVDTADRSALREVCAALEGPVVAVTTSSDHFVEAAAHLAADLGLPGPSPGAVARTRDKGRQRIVLATARVPVPRFDIVDDALSLPGAALTALLPAVVKPVGGSGSVGVRRCDSPEEIVAHGRALLADPRTERGTPRPARVLVEELLVGREVSVEIVDGRVVAVTGKHLGPEPTFVEIGHDVPADLPGGTDAAVHDVALAAVRALGLGRFPNHVELRLTADGPVVVEVNPRVAGGGIPDLVALAYGVDLLAAQRDLALGGTPDLEPSRWIAAARRSVLAPACGTVTAVDLPDGVELDPDVREVTVSVAPGDDVAVHGDFRDRIGAVVATGADRRTAAIRADAARRAVVVHTAAARPHLETV